MNITKQGEQPDATYEGACKRCGCVFECRFDETEAFGIMAEPHVRLCPGCGHQAWIRVYKVWPDIGVVKL